MIITLSDVKRFKKCSRGQRTFCKFYNIDWLDFVKNGIDAEKLRATGHPEALEIIEALEKERKNGF